VKQANSFLNLVPSNQWFSGKFLFGRVPPPTLAYIRHAAGWPVAVCKWQNQCGCCGWHKWASAEYKKTILAVLDPTWEFTALQN